MTRQEKMNICKAQSVDIARAFMALNEVLKGEDDRLDILITMLASNAGCILAPLVLNDQVEFKRCVKAMMQQTMDTAIEMARIIE